MNKSLATNLAATALLVTGFLIPESVVKPYLTNAGIFALAGAITNWLAIHMLFEKVPGLYGSGVIAARFEEFKAAIHKLVMTNFFTEENFFKFADAAMHQSLDAKMIESKVDLDDLFNGFLDIVAKSKFGGMLSMFGGTKALEPLREPFKTEFRKRLSELLEKIDLKQSHGSFDAMLPTVDNMVKGKLDELTADDVKRLLSELIREHLGWLVVWGGVFGALIGIISYPLQQLSL